MGIYRNKKQPLVEVMLRGDDTAKARVVIDDEGAKDCGEQYTHMIHIDFRSERSAGWEEGEDGPVESLEEALRILSDCIRNTGYVCDTGRFP